MKTARFGIISDIHNSGQINDALDALENEEVTGYVLLGDLGETGQNIYSNIEKTLLTKKPTIAIPGGHEPIPDWESALKQLKGEFNNQEGFNNLYDGSKPNPRTGLPHLRINKGDMSIDLIIAPGADYGPKEGCYRYSEDTDTGFYKTGDTENPDIYLFNLNDISTAVNKLKTDDPNAKPILLSHVPPQFEGKNSMDSLTTREVQEDFKLDEEVVEKGTRIINSQYGDQLISQGYPIKKIDVNAGNELLKKIVRETGIKQGIHGHLHGTTGMVQDLDSKILDPDHYHDEMFVNASCLETGKVGLYTITEDKKASYEMIELK